MGTRTYWRDCAWVEAQAPPACAHCGCSPKSFLLLQQNHDDPRRGAWVRATWEPGPREGPIAIWSLLRLALGNVERTGQGWGPGGLCTAVACNSDPLVQDGPIPSPGCSNSMCTGQDGGGVEELC